MTGSSGSSSSSRRSYTTRIKGITFIFQDSWWSLFSFLFFAASAGLWALGTSFAKLDDCSCCKQSVSWYHHIQFFFFFCDTHRTHRVWNEKMQGPGGQVRVIPSTSGRLAWNISFSSFLYFRPQIQFKGILFWKKNDFFSPSTCVFVLLVCQPAQQFWKMITCLLRFYRLLLFWFCWTFYITSRPETPLQTIFLISLYERMAILPAS